MAFHKERAIKNAGLTKDILEHLDDTFQEIIEEIPLAREWLLDEIARLLGTKGEDVLVDLFRFYNAFEYLTEVDFMVVFDSKPGAMFELMELVDYVVYQDSMYECAKILSSVFPSSRA